MAVSVQQIHPVAHLALVLGVLQRLEVATVIDYLISPHLAHVLSSGRGVEALMLAILDGEHALYKAGQRLEKRGIVALLQPGLTRASLYDDRLGGRNFACANSLNPPLQPLQIGILLASRLWCPSRY